MCTNRSISLKLNAHVELADGQTDGQINVGLRARSSPDRIIFAETLRGVTILVSQLEGWLMHKSEGGSGLSHTHTHTLPEQSSGKSAATCLIGGLWCFCAGEYFRRGRLCFCFLRVNSSFASPVNLCFVCCHGDTIIGSFSSQHIRVAGLIIRN